MKSQNLTWILKWVEKDVKIYVILTWAEISNNNNKTSLLYHLRVSHEHFPVNFVFWRWKQKLPSLGTGEITQWLRVLASLPEDPSSVTTTLMLDGSQQLLTTGQEMPSSVCCGYSSHTHTHKNTHRYTGTYFFFFLWVVSQLCFERLLCLTNAANWGILD